MISKKHIKSLIFVISILLATTSLAEAALLTSTQNSVTTTIGAQNASWSHYYSSSPNGHYFNESVTFGSGTISSYTNNYLKIVTPSGYVEVGPQNTGYSHFQTNMPKFHFNKLLNINGGEIEAYDADYITIDAPKGLYVDNTYGVFETGFGTNDSYGAGYVMRKKSDTTAWHASGPRNNGQFTFFYMPDASTFEDVMTMSKEGTVGINTETPSASYKLHVEGSIYSASTEVNASDKRLKKSIKPLAINALDTVKNLRPVTYKWKDIKDKAMEGVQTGFIAQEVRELLPTLVTEQDDEMKTLGLKNDEFTPILTKAIQELASKNYKLEDENKELKSRLDKLEEQVNSLLNK